jgi:hypothetical protein
MKEKKIPTSNVMAAGYDKDRLSNPRWWEDSKNLSRLGVSTSRQTDGHYWC